MVQYAILLAFMYAINPSASRSPSVPFAIHNKVHDSPLYRWLIPLHNICITLRFYSGLPTQFLLFSEFWFCPIYWYHTSIPDPHLGVYTFGIGQVCAPFTITGFNTVFYALHLTLTLSRMWHRVTVILFHFIQALCNLYILRPSFGHPRQLLQHVSCFIFTNLLLEILFICSIYSLNLRTICCTDSVYIEH